VKSLALVLVLSGCVSGGALTAKSEPVAIRLFSPEDATVTTTTSASAPTTDAPKIRLGRVTSSTSLRARIVHRDSPYEVGMYETFRWTDNPDVFVRRAIARALFDDGRAQQAVTGNAPTLDVDVVSFEVDRAKKQRAGRVELRWELRDETRVLASGVARSEHDAASPSMEGIVAAIAAAMNEASGEIAHKTIDSLMQRR